MKEWHEAEALWDKRAKEAAAAHPLKGLKHMPQMVGVTEETARGLKWKSFKWMLGKDENLRLIRYYFRHPFKYGLAYIKSILRKESFQREGDFFLYGVDSIDSFETLLQAKDTLFVVGFSYCHKPFECPSGRFTPDCVHDISNRVCQQCFIGKCMHTLPKEDTHPVVIPTVHYIGGEIFNVVHNNPGKRVIFLITACEMTLKMFSDWGNMVGVVGVGVRLDGRICNTMEAFALSETGIKPGLTVVLEGTQKRFLELLKSWKKSRCVSSEKVCGH